MAANSGSIDLVSSDIARHPCCSHGPTLLFERFDQSRGKSRQFYACSAFRDRKACSFFQWADTDMVADEAATDTCSVKTAHWQSRKRYHRFRKLPRKDRHVCCTCGLLLLDDELSLHESQGHVVKKKVGLKQLRQSSAMFSPLDDNKTFAQYLFSKKSVDFVLETLDQLGFSHVLCVGTPRVHEAIQCNQKRGNLSLKSMLLDLDDRYGQIYPPSKFAKYNMFNHHFFEEDGLKMTSEFLCQGKDKIVLITDPPFGGMVDALAAAFQKLSDMWREKTLQSSESTPSSIDGKCMPIIWFFPYFMENRIVSQLPGMVMLDYKVDYENHALYKNDLKQKGSPVRIFTNIPQAMFVLPAEEGYWYCSKCNRYSSKENWHCSDCGACTSKDGTTYVHCDACLRCVKPSRVHCYTCQICDLKDHVCGKKHMFGCHICGDLSHKRRDCPQKTDKGGFQRGGKISCKRKFHSSGKVKEKAKKTKIV
ncbi:rRNA N6-adenosine-methyltransferase ZCCHC4 [Aplysia californica]|uniref:rRNA N6-adenosine-methyltransferase ZCCHC4 n=1 Tax=Aplysia californica TaxID=6500 RepID=A0ABM0ZVS8_APLCA|nr:rRNA N6-adenosine-methyltransferase ZCCHC4 [Aplysia californica]XP_005094145.1 rRNA N6-adenosine-methyltransferase ZCCHC4 [Aplysia californica]XP_005094146.1 rRNA N6-adenosine-methyltransferase ZCCHC4 [Aplysia californica]XP_012935566.1 rRNA N6-adenosine-methyltransferase ZCCHC4 [Aplysia californica]XP_035824569.1 rRNA N6-adenosine-methyltransferase ZCCHC4 [Aplysia californica]